jgi:proteasome accessory factor A
VSVFERLIGLETEYALRIPQTPGRRDGPIHSHRDAYDSIVRSLSQRLPTAEADAAQGAKVGLFLGTGGVVWFESLRPTTGVGLIEGATPECRGPRELVACQRAQDRLLSEAARQHDLALVKNCRDSKGNAYGAQENYEVCLASGPALSVWRTAFWLIVLPLTILFQVGVTILTVCCALTIPFTALVYCLLRAGKSAVQRERSFDFWIGRVWRKGWNGVEIPFGGWIAKPILWCVKLAVAPLTAAVWILVQFTQLGRLQRQLTPFLVSRVVFAGAGRLDSAGRFQLSDKADSISCVASLPEFARGIFSLGQFVKPCAVLIRIGELLTQRQRLQISIGDSNLCEEAEYLRVGTTLLVLDALESGAMTDVPKLARPVKALRAFNGDPTLTRPVGLRDGQQMTALEIQHWYLDGCKRFVDQQPEVPEEARDILRRWEDVLGQLRSDRDSLVGRIDWVTKLFLLDRTASGFCETARKKIDIRYHELSPDGYFQTLAAAGLHRRILFDEEIERAMRLPPPGTPATTRARLIREFSGPGLRVGWKSLSNGVRIR